MLNSTLWASLQVHKELAPDPQSGLHKCLCDREMESLYYYVNMNVNICNHLYYIMAGQVKM